MMEWYLTIEAPDSFLHSDDPYPPCSSPSCSSRMRTLPGWMAKRTRKDALAWPHPSWSLPAVGLPGILILGLWPSISSSQFRRRAPDQRNQSKYLLRWQISRCCR